MKRLLFLMFLGFFMTETQAQIPTKWFGEWKGTMYMLKNGKLTDSVMVSLTIKPIEENKSYTWKMQYHSEKMPMTKDYKLVVKDAEKGIFLTDEGGGVELQDYLFQDKFYSVFEVQNTMLTATYEYRNNEIIFEVTSGKKTNTVAEGVTNYSVSFLQKAIFKK